jgi:3-deoxy-7-phosphoheptulonate synthase
MSAPRLLLRPDVVRDTLPLSPGARETVRAGRDSVVSILQGSDDRLLVIVGPCSIHDPIAGLEYARRLANTAGGLADDLCILMRTYFEKPRSAVGWKGLINDPGMDDTFLVNQGILTSRRLLLDILALGLPAGGEFVDPLATPFLADTMSWAAIGARTSQSPLHRQLASALPMPVGFKNATNGDVAVAIDAARAAALPQVALGVTDDGLAAAFDTTGNPDTHVVLRGGSNGPNYDGATVAATSARLEGWGLSRGVIIDASHDNSGKDHRKQVAVAARVADAVARAEPGFAGIMLESFLVSGRQSIDPRQGSALTFGQSVTDACMGWDDTRSTLERLARAVRRRRQTVADRETITCGAQSDW